MEFSGVMFVPLIKKLSIGY